MEWQTNTHAHAHTQGYCNIHTHSPPNRAIFVGNIIGDIPDRWGSGPNNSSAAAMQTFSVCVCVYVQYVYILNTHRYQMNA